MLHIPSLLTNTRGSVLENTSNPVFTDFLFYF